MIPSLYDSFKHWSNNGSVYIISDTHFEDGDCKYMDAEWPDPQTHINNIKKYVHKNDTLIHLGDVGNAEWLNQIKAYKVLIMGNHDSGASNYLKKESYIVLDNCVKEEIDKLWETNQIDYIYSQPYKPFNTAVKTKGVFDEVYTGPVFISDKLLLSHEPIHDDRWFNIHGHDHNDLYPQGYNYRNLASNCTRWGVFNLGEEIKNGLLSEIKNIHRLTIDNATEKKYGS